jgi:hypothetical protein
VAVLTQGGRLLLFPLAELKEMAKGKGLMLIDLAKNDEVVGVAVSAGQTLRIGGSGRGGKPVEQPLDARAQADFQGNRARRGQEIPFKLKPASLALTSNIDARIFQNIGSSASACILFGLPPTENKKCFSSSTTSSPSSCWSCISPDAGPLQLEWLVLVLAVTVFPAVIYL